MPVIRWLTDPEYLTDEELHREFQATTRDDERATALLDEIRRRGLNEPVDE